MFDRRDLLSVSLNHLLSRPAKRTRIVEEERIVWLRILDKPVHSTQDVGLGWLAHGVLLVIGQNDHVLACIAEVLIQVCRHVLHIVDAPAQLTLLSEIVDTNQQRLPLTGTARVLEVVALRSAMSERDRGTRRRRRPVARGRTVCIRYGILSVHVDGNGPNA